MKTKVCKRWQFGWCDANSPPTKDGDSHEWKSKIFRCSTFETAMDKMLDFLTDKPFECLVDYECAALHVEYVPSKHDEHFHRIDCTEHQLRELI